MPKTHLYVTTRADGSRCGEVRWLCKHVRRNSAYANADYIGSDLENVCLICVKARDKRKRELEALGLSI